MTTRKSKKQHAYAAVKGKHMTVLRELAPMAKEINVRLTKANKMEDDAYDHRLAAALVLDKAKKRATKSKFNFKKWCEENVQQSYETVRKLVAVGGAPDPQKALEDMRGRNKAYNKKSRDKKKAETVSRETKETPATRIASGFEAITDTHGIKLVKDQAKSYGLVVVTTEDAKAVAKKKGSIFSQVQALFNEATPAEQMEIVTWVVEQVGCEIDDGLEVPAQEPEDTSTASVEDLLEIPAALDRKGKNGDNPSA